MAFRKNEEKKIHYSFFQERFKERDKTLKMFVMDQKVKFIRVLTSNGTNSDS